MGEPTGNFDITAWIFPRQWTERKIRNSKVADAVFDVGPGGLSGWFTQMQKEKTQAVKRLVAAVTAFGVMDALFGLIAWWTGGDLGSWEIVELLVFVLWISLPLRAAWHWSAAQAYAREWGALESRDAYDKQEPLWHFENGSWFRYTFKRRDGSYKIDTNTRQQRLDAERAAVATRDGSITSQAKEIMTTLAVAAALYVGSKLAVDYVRWAFATRWDVPLFLTSWLLLSTLPEPVAEWLKSLREKKFYEQGKQFIPAPRVMDSPHMPWTLETVKEQAVFGGDSAGFVKPGEASRKLRL